MRIHLRSLGCRLNEAELNRWADDFVSAGHGLAASAEEADVVVLNTCAVTTEAVRKSRQLIHRLRRLNPQARLVVSGCHATLAPQEMARRLGVDLVVSNAAKDRLVDIALTHLGLEAQPPPGPAPAPLFLRGRQRVFVKVQDGCRYRCSYCIVTRARGEERSRPLADVVDAVNRHHGQGVQEVVLTGVQLGGYGAGIGSSLPELIEALLRESAVPRIRLGAVEPWSVAAYGERFIRLFESPRLMPHLHLPLQSGADAVLRRMARQTRVVEYAALIEALRRAILDLNVTTDIIVGFPGESEVEWGQTLDGVARLRFGDVHVFGYSRRGGTKAAGLPDQVPPRVRQARCGELQRLVTRLRRAALSAQVGRCVPVLWERPEVRRDDGSTFPGYTPSYFRVVAQVPAAHDLENRIQWAMIDGVTAGGDALQATALHTDARPRA